MVIAIDGPAGAGKSTVARAVAAELGFTYLDTGAMYRCVALASLRERVPVGRTLGAVRGGFGVGLGRAIGERDSRAAALAGELELQLGERVLMNGEDVTDAIRAPAVSGRASLVAADTGVRRALVAQQQRLLRDGDWVAEGRDIGTVVAPGADVKVFLTADPRERARRRAAEIGAEVDVVLAEQAIRDRRDRDRSDSPLRPAGDATTVDTTGRDLNQVIAQIVALARRVRGR